MKFFKFSLIILTFGIFLFACSQTPTTNSNAVTSNANVTTTNGTVISSGAPSASYNSANSDSTNELASAQKIYEEKCIKCHKADGMGGVTDIEGTKIKAPNFTTDRQKAMPDSEYIDTIENGAKEDGMPAYKGKISDDDIKNLVKYIRKNFQGKS